MNILIDTHIALWSLYDDGRLSPEAAEYLCRENNVVYYSLVSAWEIEIKHSLGKLEVPAEAFIEDCALMGFELLPLKKEHILEVSRVPFLPNGHKDPFDRMLMAQAISENMSFLTMDGKIRQYGYDWILDV